MLLGSALAVCPERVWRCVVQVGCVGFYRSERTSGGEKGASWTMALSSERHAGMYMGELGWCHLLICPCLCGREFGKLRGSWASGLVGETGLLIGSVRRGCIYGGEVGGKRSKSWGGGCCCVAEPQDPYLCLLLSKL